MTEDTKYTPIEKLESFPENKDAIIIAVQISFKNDTKEDIHAGLIELAKETSSGTWVEIKTATEESRRADAWIIHEKGNIGYIGLPPENWDLSGGFNNLWANIGGNYFGLRALKKARLLDVYFPPRIVKNFPGPRYGMHGIYEKLGGIKRMIAGSIVKPKMGLGPVEWAKVAENVFFEADLVKDDENLCNQVYCPWDQRFKEVMTRQQKIIDETGDKKMYVHNITTRDIPGRAKEVQALAEELSTPHYTYMIDGVIAGLNAVHDLRERKEFDAPIYIHRAMHAAITRSADYGITMLVFAKLFRMAGADYLHTGTYGSGKMGEKEELEPELLEDLPDEIPVHLLDSTAFLNRALTRKWEHLKPTLPMASGGLFPGALPRIRRFNEAIGNDYRIGCNAGGGIHGHPDGTRQGAKAFKDVAAIIETEDYRSLKTPDEKKKFLLDFASKPGNEHVKKAFDKREWGLLV
ncbi:MAG: RuBisCO large subunit C-terminal-like domain-containing protein [Candidatus Helarchaeales archaeon]